MAFNLSNEAVPGRIQSCSAESEWEFVWFMGEERYGCVPAAGTGAGDGDGDLDAEGVGATFTFNVTVGGAEVRVKETWVERRPYSYVK